MDDALLSELAGLTGRRGTTRYRALADDSRRPSARVDWPSTNACRPNEVWPPRSGSTAHRRRGLRGAPGPWHRADDPARDRRRTGCIAGGQSAEAWLAGALPSGALLDRLVPPTRQPWTCEPGCGDAADLSPDLLTLDPADLVAHAGPTDWAPGGLGSLRERIADRLGATGLPDQVLVTNGAQQATSLLVRSLVEPGSPVAVEELTSAGVMAALTVARADVCGIPDATWRRRGCPRRRR